MPADAKFKAGEHVDCSLEPTHRRLHRQSSRCLLHWNRRDALLTHHSRVLTHQPGNFHHSSGGTRHAPTQRLQALCVFLSELSPIRKLVSKCRVSFVVHVSVRSYVDETSVCEHFTLIANFAGGDAAGVT